MSSTESSRRMKQRYDARDLCTQCGSDRSDNRPFKHCGTCKEKYRQWCLDNKDDQRSKRIAYQEIPSNRWRILVGMARRRAEKAGLPFDPILLEILTNNPPSVCQCCGVTLDYTVGRGKANFTSRSPSIDRFEGSEGYTIANSRIVCTRCNSLKNDATIEELRAVVAYMERG